MSKYKIAVFFNVTYSVILLLFLLDVLTGFDIKSQTIKTIVYIEAILGAVLILILNWLLAKPGKYKVIGIFIPAIVAVGIIINNPLRLIFASSAWKTQTILYQQKDSSIKKIERQMQEIEAHGYKDRTVEVVYITPAFMIVNEVEPSQIDKTQWKEVNRQVNELGLKFP